MEATTAAETAAKHAELSSVVSAHHTQHASDIRRLAQDARGLKAAGDALSRRMTAGEMHSSVTLAKIAADLDRLHAGQSAMAKCLKDAGERADHEKRTLGQLAADVRSLEACVSNVKAYLQCASTDVRLMTVESGMRVAHDRMLWIVQGMCELWAEIGQCTANSAQTDSLQHSMFDQHDTFEHSAAMSPPWHLAGTRLTTQPTDCFYADEVSVHDGLLVSIRVTERKLLM
ncbi:hypothetical protein GQ42DRAFT_72121 [Ramicandelaber brevisporus]|nr:hypothetical protein GQ42DRAFT_72121 [Ramicandelaber brevisporus]